MAAGSTLRPNSSLAPILGSLGLASGGSGFGLTVPLSCAQRRGAGDRNDVSERDQNQATDHRSTLVIMA